MRVGRAGWGLRVTAYRRETAGRERMLNICYGVLVRLQRMRQAGVLACLGIAPVPRLRRTAQAASAPRP